MFVCVTANDVGFPKQSQTPNMQVKRRCVIPVLLRNYARMRRPTTCRVCWDIPCKQLLKLFAVEDTHIGHC